MATEANARARAAVDLKNLLRRITSTSSFVLEAYVTSGPTEVDRLWECLHILLEGCDIGEDCIVLSASLLNAGAVDTLVGLMLEFPSSTCSEPPTPWLISTEVSGLSGYQPARPLNYYCRGLHGTGRSEVWLG